VQQGGQDLASNILQMLTSQTQQFLCLQNLILEPTNDQFLLQFYESTSIWLTQLSTKVDPENMDSVERKAKGFAPTTIENFELPATNEISNLLKSIPEFILENIVGYLQFSRHSDAPSIRVDYEAQTNLFTMILLFMGSSERVRNPHLRARLADGLESLLPKEGAKVSYQLGTTLFMNHSWKLQIVPNLLNVFVSIEMTG
jgi:ubiquitin conjugation factor E4 A